MDWKLYEQIILDWFKRAYPNSKISHNVTVVGRYSKVPRQIDIIIEDMVAGFHLKIAIDAKYYSSKVDVKVVESFIAMLEDIEVDQGMIITSVGYSVAALDRAYNGPSKLELDILSFDELEMFQGLVAIPYSGHRALHITAPLGWLIQISKDQNSPAYLYQRGKSLEEAMAEGEWMYVNFWHKDKEISDIESLVAGQNANILDAYSNVVFKEEISPVRADGLPTYIRSVEADGLHGCELTGFIDSDDFIVFVVCHTRMQLKSVNMRRLVFLLNYAQPIHDIQFNNTSVIDQLVSELETEKDKTVLVKGYLQLANWHNEMGQFEDELRYRQLVFSYLPSHYFNIFRLISLEINFGNMDEAELIALDFISMDPSNPRVMQDLVAIYHKENLIDQLLKVFDTAIAKYNKLAEVLANIYFHMGLFFMHSGNVQLAKLNFAKAKVEFEIFDKSHMALALIQESIESLSTE